MNSWNRERFLTLLIVIILGTNSFIFFKYQELKDKYEILKRESFAQSFNEKVLNFSDMFVNIILKSETDVSFEDRLRLENTVRELEDQEILKWWTDFINSQTELQAQTAVKNLLAVLVKKIRLQ